MSRDKEFLLDILEAARLALSYVEGRTEASFLGDVQCQDAVIRRLEVLGEASRRLSEDTRRAIPEVPWNKVVGMRNIMIHEYDDVDLTIVWESVHQSLPGMAKCIEVFLSRESGRE